MKRAFSLAEILVVMSLLVVLMTLMTLFLTRIFRYGHKNLEQNGRTHRAETLYRQLLRDLRLTSSAGVTWQPTLGSLVIQPLETVSPAGQLVYSSRQLILYAFQARQKQVIRKEFNGLSLPSQDPQRLDLVRVQELLDNQQVGQQIYLDIEEFDLGSELGGSNLSSPLHPRVTFLADRVYGLPKQVKVKLEQELFLTSCP